MTPRFTSKIFAALLCGLLSGAALAAAYEVPSLPIPAGSDSQNRLYPLGKIDGFSVYGFRRSRVSQPEPKMVCACDSVVLVAGRQQMDNERATGLLKQAAKKLYTACDKKIVYGGGGDSVRTVLHGLWFDDELFKLFRIDEYDVDVRPLLEIRSIPLDDKVSAQDQQLLDHWRKMEPTLKANEARMKGWFDKHNAAAWVPMGDFATNPFKYSGKVIVTAVRMERAMSASVVAVSEPRGNGYGAESAILTGTDVSRWADGGHLVVIKPSGRYQNDEKAPASGQVLDFAVCKETDCNDLRVIPDPQPKPGLPAVRVLTAGERL